MLVHEGGAAFCPVLVEGAGARLETSAAVPEEVASGQLGLEIFMFKGSVGQCRGGESQQYKRLEAHGAMSPLFKALNVMEAVARE